MLPFRDPWRAWRDAGELRRRVDEFLASRRAKNCSAATLLAYAWALGKLPPPPLSPAALESRLGELELAPESRWDVFRVWRTWSRWCARRYLVPDLVAELERPVVPKQPPRGLPWGVVQRALQVARTRRDRVLVLLALDTGLRLSEIHGLTPDDVAGDTVTVVGKGGRIREVPVSPEVRQRLRGLLPWRTADGRRPLTRRGLQVAFKRLLRRAGATGGPHRLRHTMARSYLDDGGDLVTLQALLGHSDVRTTERYARAPSGAVRAAHRRHSPALRLLAEAGSR